jgi:hypothetical protein
LVLLAYFIPISSVASWNTKDGSITVYVTDYGSKYHASGCGSLWNSQHSISLIDAVKKGYTPCSRCDPPIYTGVIPTEPTERETPKATSSSNSGKTTASNKTSSKDSTDFAGKFFPIISILLLCIYPTSKLLAFSKADDWLPGLIIHACISGPAITALGWAAWDWNKRYFLITTSCCLLIFTIVCAICRSLDAKRIEEEKRKQARLEAERRWAMHQKAVAQLKKCEQSYLRTAANGMQVWVPADKLEAWEAAQADQSEEAQKRRERMTAKILERMEQIKQDHLNKSHSSPDLSTSPKQDNK